MEKINIITLTCKRCGHNWSPRKQYVGTCPNQKCKSPYWNLDDEEFAKLKSAKDLNITDNIT